MADRRFFRRRIFAATALVPAAVAICLKFGFYCFGNHSVKLRQAFAEKLDGVTIPF
jgi:hypothetical protein